MFLCFAYVFSLNYFFVREERNWTWPAHNLKVYEKKSLTMLVIIKGKIKAMLLCHFIPTIVTKVKRAQTLASVGKDANEHIKPCLHC